MYHTLLCQVIEGLDKASDELKREDECSKYDLEALWRELPMYHTLLCQVIEGLDKASDELLTTAKTLDELDILKGY